MYSSGLDNSVINRESLRQMALAQAFNSACYQVGKERIPQRCIAQRSSPKRYGSPTRPVGSYGPYASLPSPKPSPPHIDTGIQGFPSMLHSDPAGAQQSSCWYEQNNSWYYPEQPSWKSMAPPTYQASMNQGSYSNRNSKPLYSF